jgi:hypothetical protein
MDGCQHRRVRDEIGLDGQGFSILGKALVLFEPFVSTHALAARRAGTGKRRSALEILFPGLDGDRNRRNLAVPSTGESL